MEKTYNTLTYEYSIYKDYGFRIVRSDWETFVRSILCDALQEDLQKVVDGYKKYSETRIKLIDIYDLPDFIKEEAIKTLREEGLDDDLSNYKVLEVENRDDLGFDGVWIFIHI